MALLNTGTVAPVHRLGQLAVVSCQSVRSRAANQGCLNRVVFIAESPKAVQLKRSTGTTWNSEYKHCQCRSNAAVLCRCLSSMRSNRNEKMCGNDSNPSNPLPLGKKSRSEKRPLFIRAYKNDSIAIFVYPVNMIRGDMIEKFVPRLWFEFFDKPDGVFVPAWAQNFNNNHVDCDSRRTTHAVLCGLAADAALTADCTFRG